MQRKVFNSKKQTKIKTISANDYQKTATHKQLEEAIEQYMDWMQIEGTHTDASRAWGKDGQPRPGKVKEGWPDRTYLLKPYGKMFCIEIKTENDELKPKQIEVISSIIDSGGIVVVARSVEDVKKALVAYMNSIKENNKG